LASYDGLYQIDDNFRPGKGELQVRLKPGAEHLGFTLDSVSRQLYAAYQGEEAITLLRDREEVKVRVRLPRNERERLSDFTQFRLRAPGGDDVPLASVAVVTHAEGVTTISGVNGVRGISVSASADRERVNPAEINREIMDHYLPGLLERHPGVTWSLSMIDEDNQRMLSELRTYTMLSLLVIFVILCTVFHSYIQPVLIMLIIPFGFSGAVLGHMLLGIPLSFLSLAGLVALSGIIVNDSIVLIERINAYLAEGCPFHEAVCAAGQRRFRAIFLTSATTVIGLGPMILETDLTAQVVAPMGVSVGAGLAVGMSLTLLLMPALFAILNDARRAVFRAWHGRWPSPEEVEPASQRNEATIRSAEPEHVAAA
jgi:multidrug efflux pump subunit AcrB